MKSIIAKNIPLAQFAGPGGWNDPDMLEIGNAGLTTNEWQTEMSMWSEMAAPLLIGTDLTKASAAAISILSNAEVIAIDQDSLGKQGAQVANHGGLRAVDQRPRAGARGRPAPGHRQLTRSPGKAPGLASGAADRGQGPDRCYI